MFGGGNYIQTFKVYDSAEWVSSGAVTDYDVSGQSNLFNRVKNARYVAIRTDQPITIKLNDTTYPSITVNPNTPFEIGQHTHHIYVTTTTTTNLKIVLQS